MYKRKIRFNGVDLFILLFIAAAIFLLLYVFVFDNDNPMTDGASEEEIEYVILVQNVDESLAYQVKIGQTLKESVKKQEIGEVIGVQSKPYVVSSFDYESGKEVSTTVEGKINLEITVKAKVNETDRAFTINGCEIRVGESYGIMFPNFFGTGRVIVITD